MNIGNRYPNAATLRLGAPQWVLDLLLLVSALSAVVCLLFLASAVDTSARYRHGATLITVMAAILGFMVLMCVRAIFQRSPKSLTIARTVATVICLTVVFLPLGVAILVGLKRAQPDVWQYEPAHRRVALLLVIPLLAWIALDLQFATGGRGTYLVPATSLVTAIILSATVGVLLRRAWARSIAALAALLTALTGSLVGGNLLAAALSSPVSYTLGASGAIMGLFGAMVRAGTRFRSEGDSLVWSAGLVLATLIYGFLHSGVSNSAHIGGLLIGFCIAAGIGTDPAWTSQVRRLEWSRRAESERERAEALHHRPLPSAIADPSNRIVLRMSAGQRVRRWALATVFPIVFAGDVVLLLTLGCPPTSAELGFAGLAAICALPSIVVVLATLGVLSSGLPGSGK